MSHSFLCSAGIEVMANRFSVIQTQIKKKPYDFLDQRKQEFLQDYEDFQRQIKELHVSFQILSWIGIFSMIFSMPKKKEKKRKKSPN